VKDQDKRRFYDLLLTEYAINGKPKPTGNMARLWWNDLKCYNFEMLEKAFKEHRRTNKWMPKPAEIHCILHLALDHARYTQKTPSIEHKMTSEEREAGLAKLRQAKEQLK
jgi:hypothetical protein